MNGTSAVNGTKPTHAITHTCDTCGTDCTALRYHSLKVKDFELCSSCYLDGRFPSTMFSGDFVKLVANGGVGGYEGGSTDDWSDQELLLLLEGVEMFDDDWTAVEEHVGTRSAQQCIRKFLELPIEDPYLAAEGAGVPPGEGETSEGAMGALRFARVPFEQADNPVMSVVAFLAGVVGPGVAAEAAKTALIELTDGDKKAGASEKEEGGEAIAEDGEGPKEEKADKETDAMDEDGETQGEKAESATEGASASPSAKPTAKIPHSKVVRAARLALNSSAKAAAALASAEDLQIRGTLAQLIKLTLTKLELKMGQFEELEEILEEERRGLESARMALVAERVGLKRMLDSVRAELAKNGGGPGMQTALANTNLGTTGQGTVVNPVAADVAITEDAGPVADASMLQLS